MASGTALFATQIPMSGLASWITRLGRRLLLFLNEGRGGGGGKGKDKEGRWKGRGGTGGP